MKLTALISSLLLVVGASAAQAQSINGAWQGNFNSVGSDGSTSSVQGFDVGVTSTANSITFSEPMGLTLLDGVKVTINGSTLVYNDHNVGTIYGSEISITFQDDIDGIYDTVNMTFNQDGSMNYTDYMADYSGDYIQSNSIAFPTASVDRSHAVPRGQAIIAMFHALKRK